MPMLGSIAAPNVRKVVAESIAFGSIASAAGLGSGAGRILPVVTGMSNHNAAVVGNLYFACCILKPLAATGAYIVCFVAVLGAGRARRTRSDTGQSG